MRQLLYVTCHLLNVTCHIRASHVTRRADNPLPSGQIRNQQARSPAAQERADSNSRDRRHRRQFHITLKERRPHTQPEYMNQIHAITEIRDLKYDTRSLRLLYAGEEKKSAGSEHKTIDCAKRPSDLKHGSLMNHTRHRLYIERKNSPNSTHYRQHTTDHHTFTNAPIKMHTYI